MAARSQGFHPSVDQFLQPGLVKKSQWFTPVRGVSIEMPTQTRAQTQFLQTAESDTFATMMGVFNSSAEAGIFVDSGANDGMWSLLAAKHGMPAVAVEPQLLCLGYIAAAAKRNALSIQLHHKVLSPHAFDVNVRTDHCTGSSQFLPDGQTGDSLGRTKRTTTATTHARVSSVSLDDLLGRQVVALWHIDTEGAEVDVLRSAERLFANQRIRRVLLEWNPTRWARFNISRDDAIRVAQQVFGGWSCRDFCGRKAVDWVERSTKWNWKTCRKEEIYCTLPNY